MQRVHQETRAATRQDFACRGCTRRLWHLALTLKKVHATKARQQRQAKLTHSKSDSPTELGFVRRRSSHSETRQQQLPP